MTTPNLALAHILAAQSNKETTANAGLDGLDNAMNTIRAQTVTTSFLLTQAEFRGNFLHRLTGSPAGDFTMRIPGSITKLFGVQNLTSRICYVEVSNAGTDFVVVLPGEMVILHADGSDVNRYDAESFRRQNVSGNYTFVASDFYGGRIKVGTSASPSTWGLPAGLVVNRPCTIIQGAGGVITFAEDDSSVSILSSDSRVQTRGIWSVCTLIPLGSNQYLLAGDIQ